MTKKSTIVLFCICACALVGWQATDSSENSHQVVYRTQSLANQNDQASILAAGKKVYKRVCTVCHQAGGQGVPGAFPPVLNSDYIKKNPKGIIPVLIKGLKGKITVNGKQYNMVMPPPNLKPEEIASVATYVLVHFNKISKTITVDDVKKAGAK